MEMRKYNNKDLNQTEHHFNQEAKKVQTQKEWLLKTISEF
jgi:hypothetical protein